MTKYNKEIFTKDECEFINLLRKKEKIVDEFLKFDDKDIFIHLVVKTNGKIYVNGKKLIFN